MKSMAHGMLAMALKEQNVFEKLSQEICTIKLKIILRKLENVLLARIVNKILVEINVLCTLAATNVHQQGLQTSECMSHYRQK